MAVEIFEEIFGSNHPDVATALGNKAALLEAQVKRKIVGTSPHVAVSGLVSALQCAPHVTQRESWEVSWQGVAFTGLVFACYVRRRSPAQLGLSRIRHDADKTVEVNLVPNS